MLSGGKPWDEKLAESGPHFECIFAFENSRNQLGFQIASKKSNNSKKVRRQKVNLE